MARGWMASGPELNPLASGFTSSVALLARGAGRSGRPGRHLPSCSRGIRGVCDGFADGRETQIIEARQLLERAIALAELEGPTVALALLDELELDNYQYFHSTRADLLRRLGRSDEARAVYTRALQLAQAEGERRFLQAQLHELRL